MQFPIVDLSEPTLDQQKFMALQAQEAELSHSLDRILDALDIDGSEDGWLEDAIDLIERLRNLEDAVHVVRAEAQADPVAHRYLVPTPAFAALRKNLDG